MFEEIILFWRICHLDIFTDTRFTCSDRYHNISLSLKNVMFVECLYLLNWYLVEFSVETNRTVEIVESVEYVEYAF